MKAQVATTPRRAAIDVARVVALLVVVLGHLLLAVIDRDGGELRGANLLALRPGWAWIAALAPMPVFFAAAGWANASATPSGTAGRLRSLVGLGAIVVGLWSTAVLVAGGQGPVGDGARIATQPLWFLAAYVPMAMAGARIARVASGHPLGAAAAILATLAALDVARFRYGAPDWIGWPGFFLAWGLPWLAGAWWRSRQADPAFRERRAGFALAAGGGAACAALVAFAGYEPALIDAVPGARSNTTPPTLYTATAALAQVGVLMLAAGWLDRAGRRWQPMWARAGEASVGVYVWHLTALALCAGVVAAGFEVPTRLTVAWWLTRPLWWLAVLGVTAMLVQATAAARARLGGRTGPVPARRALVAVVLVTAGAGLVGIEGPRSVASALACVALFAGAWWLLRPARPTAAGPAGRQRRR